LAARATALGWPAQQVIVIDEDLGLSGSGVVERSGFSRLTADVALRHVGLCSVSRSPASPATMPDWYRCSISAASPTRSSAMIIAHAIETAERMEITDE